MNLTPQQMVERSQRILKELTSPIEIVPPADYGNVAMISGVEYIPPEGRFVSNKSLRSLKRNLTESIGAQD